MRSNDIAKYIIEASGFSFNDDLKIIGVGGGSINYAYRIQFGSEYIFVKLNQGVNDDFFEAERKGLELLSKHSGFKIPKVFVSGTIGQHRFIAMEYINSSLKVANYWFQAGVTLAEMHKSSSEKYGLSFNNYMGSLPQKNSWTDKWADFFIEKRLRPQVDLAHNNGLMDVNHVKLFEKLYSIIESIVPEEVPSLIHGDLWNGNIMTDENGLATIIDPAIHYGHRESDLAMTFMFGGFANEFYQGYSQTYPLQSDFSYRVGLYNLYPLLIHVNLFGTGYLGETISTLKKYLN
ncbi:fructosamine kinase family protein [Marinigracilibium pacificum]|uniref:Fructosamine kinase family protein n=1 Tax=Marinigracilibium pacificum TaxID=2729599 RepID=A0A848IZB4_9BACT|nr:fructosamine kinase family protein [Marinigracilibium pacificum]NMM48625.1 fructosamine kinase family protein [Marinigracilibium pacificum]